MSLKSFRVELLDRVLTFLWREWSALGVMGQGGLEDDWVLDPESLFVFTLEVGRYDARLFDEVLGWAAINGRWMDIWRLRTITRARRSEAIRVVGASVQYLSHRGDAGKWGNLAGFCRTHLGEKASRSASEPLFRSLEGKPHPYWPKDRAEPDFAAFGINRAAVSLRKRSVDVPINARTHLRFLLRAFLGIGAKSECVAYLLTHDGGRPSEIADAVDLHPLTVQLALKDLAASSMVQIRHQGKRIEYWVSQERWWDFLSRSGQDSTQRPKWLNWSQVLSALADVVGSVDDLSASEASDYLKSSRLYDAVEVLSREFARGGMDVSLVPRKDLPLALFQRTAIQFLETVLGMKSVDAVPVSAVDE
jgi:hypothetical protein